MKHDHPTSAMAVANWFLQRSWRDRTKPPCDQMKLYKLVYYAHAWYLGNCNQELFADDIEAWPHGPVIRDLYAEFHPAGSGPIRRLGERIECIDGNYEKIIPVHDGSLDNFFENIWTIYGHYSGIQLSNMTHESGEPWAIVAEKYDYNLRYKPSIPSEIIRDVFGRKIKKQPA